MWNVTLINLKRLIDSLWMRQKGLAGYAVLMILLNASGSLELHDD